jgi:hypothetical protein
MHHQLRLLFVCASTAIAVACSTPYQDMGLLGGVSATQVDANTMRISSRGNAFSDIGRMKDYVLLRAAEETLKRGYDVFWITDSENVTRRETLQTTETHSEPVMGSAIVPGYGPVPVMGVGHYTTSSSSTLIKPGEDIFVKMFKGPKPDLPNVYSAAEVVTYLGPSVVGDHYVPPVSLQPARASAVAAAQPDADAPTPQPACTASDRQLAEVAKRNGYQYAGTCQ